MTRVHAETQFTSSSHNWIKDDNIISSIENEKDRHIEKSEQRMNLYNAILQNQTSGTSSSMHIPKGLVGILGPLISSMAYTRIPVHNVFEMPQYWYEFPIQILFALVHHWAAMILYKCSFYMNITYIRDLKHFVVMFCVGGIVLFSTYGSEYLIWTVYLQYPYPFPFNGYVIAATLMVAFYVTLWFRFPLEWRNDEAFRNRLLYFLIAITLNQAVLFEYAGITIILLTIPDEYQWVVVVFFPLLREVNLVVSRHFARKATNGDITTATIVCSHAIATTHCVFLAYTVGSIATLTSSIIILTEDFLINIGLCLWIIYIRKKNPDETERQINLLQELAINEIVEAMVPMLYLLCFTLAYYGPNSALIGNVGNSDWQYQAVDDFGYSFSLVFIFFLVDVCSAIIGAILLWIFCHIKLHRAYVAIQNEFGIGFSFILGTNLNGVSILHL